MTEKTIRDARAKLGASTAPDPEIRWIDDTLGDLLTVSGELGADGIGEFRAGYQLAVRLMEDLVIARLDARIAELEKEVS